MTKPPTALGVTEVVLRDGNQSLLATRLKLDDILPIASDLDDIGYSSIESWGGATFDACIRFLNEDPWDRLRELKKAMPKTPQQMLLRGQNLLGYRHYADDVVEKFISHAAANGIDIFRVFDALNDTRNLKTSILAIRRCGKHAQGTIAYTTSPVHTMQLWLDTARRIEDSGAHSLCIKDMAGLLTPYAGFELVSKLKEALDIPIHLHCHATTGLSTATIIKCIEAGVDNVDTSISSMSMKSSHTATETVASMLEGTTKDPGLDWKKLETVATYFRKVRTKYAEYEGSLRGVDARILSSQIPGGMLTNMESQLRQQGAEYRLDEVLAEVPKVREDFGFAPLVTPTSQIIGSQAILNVLTGQRYKIISREAAGLLRGEYGTTPAPVNRHLLERVTANGDAIIDNRPADQLKPEISKLSAELFAKSPTGEKKGKTGIIDDLLTYALLPQSAVEYFKSR